MSTYSVRFRDPTVPSMSIEADNYNFPEEEWGDYLFYTGNEKDPVIVASVAREEVLSIVLMSTQ